MIDISLKVLTDAGKGLLDSITGLLLIFELDQEEPQTSTPQQSRQNVRTVLQERRERRGQAPPPRTIDEVAPRVKAWKRVLQCIASNLIIAATLQLILIFLPWIGELMLPKKSTDYTNVISLIGVFPMFLFSRIINILWFSDIAGACRRALQIKESRPVDFRTWISDFIIAIVLEAIFLLQSAAVMHIPIPIVAPVLSFIHLSLLHSLYSFEYFWMDRRLMLSKRVEIMQKNWSYFVGFGTPLTVAAWISPNFVVGGCLFGALFPLFIISSFKSAAKRSDSFSEPNIVPSLNIFTPSLLVTDRFATHISSFLLRR